MAWLQSWSCAILTSHIRPQQKLQSQTGAILQQYNSVGLTCKDCPGGQASWPTTLFNPSQKHSCHFTSHWIFFPKKKEREKKKKKKNRKNTHLLSKVINTFYLTNFINLYLDGAFKYLPFFWYLHNNLIHLHQIV